MREKEREETKGVSVRERKRKKKKGWPYRHLLPPTDIQALQDFSVGLQRREDWNLALPEIRPDQNQKGENVTNTNLD